jgi:hypothetical protein
MLACTWVARASHLVSKLVDSFRNETCWCLHIGYFYMVPLEINNLSNRTRHRVLIFCAIYLVLPPRVSPSLQEPSNPIPNPQALVLTSTMKRSSTHKGGLVSKVSSNLHPLKNSLRAANLFTFPIRCFFKPAFRSTSTERTQQFECCILKPQEPTTSIAIKETEGLRRAWRARQDRWPHSNTAGVGSSLEQQKYVNQALPQNRRFGGDFKLGFFAFYLILFCSGFSCIKCSYQLTISCVVTILKKTYLNPVR